MAWDVVGQLPTRYNFIASNCPWDVQPNLYQVVCECLIYWSTLLSTLISRFLVTKKIYVAGFGVYGSVHGPDEYHANIEVSVYTIYR